MAEGDKKPEIDGSTLLAYHDAFNQRRKEREEELTDARKGTSEKKQVKHIFPGTMSEADAAALKYHIAITDKPEPDAF